MRKILFIWIFLIMCQNCLFSESIKLIEDNKKISYMKIYFHTFEYFDTGLSIKALKNKFYENIFFVSKEEIEINFSKECFILNNPIINDSEKQNLKMNHTAQILVELYNAENQIIGWYSFCETDKDIILINGYLVHVSEDLIQGTKKLLNEKVDCCWNNKKSIG